MVKLMHVIGLCSALFTSGCDKPMDAFSVNPTVPMGVEPTSLASGELSRLGRRELNAGNAGLAERYYREALERDARDSSSWMGLAVAYDDLKRFELADRAYAQAIRLGGETLVLMNNLGYSYYLRGDRARALEQFERAASMDPDNPIVRNNLALANAMEPHL